MDAIATSGPGTTLRRWDDWPFRRAARSASVKVMTTVRREPAWSNAFTSPLARRIPSGWRQSVVVTVKAFHTAAFISIFGLIVLVAWDGFHGRSTLRTRLAAAIALAETAIFASNNQVCPLTSLVEELGAASGSVTDIFLPDSVSRRIPLFSGGLLMVGLVLQARLRGRRTARA